MFLQYWTVTISQNVPKLRVLPSYASWRFEVDLKLMSIRHVYNLSTSYGSACAHERYFSLNKLFFLWTVSLLGSKIQWTYCHYFSCRFLFLCLAVSKPEPELRFVLSFVCFGRLQDDAETSPS